MLSGHIFHLFFPFHVLSIGRITFVVITVISAVHSSLRMCLPVIPYQNLINGPQQRICHKWRTNIVILWFSTGRSFEIVCIYGPCHYSLKFVVYGIIHLNRNMRVTTQINWKRILLLRVLLYAWHFRDYRMLPIDYHSLQMEPSKNCQGTFASRKGLALTVHGITT